MLVAVNVRPLRRVGPATRHRAIRTVVSLNSIMIDGTGMCGGCRVSVDGRSRFACVDGPEFDAHRVDFQVLRNRNAMYRSWEQKALARYEADPAAELSRVPGHHCRLEALKVGA